MGKFEIRKDKAGRFRFNLKARNGQVILSSEAYNSKPACENGIASVKKNSYYDANFERKTAKNGQPYFNLKAGNGQVIGSSERYSSKSAMENGIESVKRNAKEAIVEHVGKPLEFCKTSSIPFQMLLEEMYNNQKDRTALLGIERVIIENKEDYCLVHLYTMINAIKGYLVNMEEQ